MPTMSTSRGKIGIFDSGVGGLSVFQAIAKKLPEFDYLYFADSARAPYGSRPAQTIREFTEEAVQFLTQQGANLIILACNSASSDALRFLQQHFVQPNVPRVKILGVLVPVAESIVSLPHAQRIGILATVATVTSEAYLREIHKLSSTAHIIQEACPQLVPFIERGELQHPELIQITQKHVNTLVSNSIDTLILGCTHYEWLRPMIESLLPADMPILSAADAVPDKLADYLERHPEIRAKLRTKPGQRFFTTGDPERFSHIGSALTGLNIRAEHACLTPNSACHFCSPHSM